MDTWIERYRPQESDRLKHEVFMALFLGAKGSDILSSRTVKDLVNGVHERLAREMSALPTGAELPLLKELQALLDDELEFERQFAVKFLALLDRVDEEEGELLPLRTDLGSLVHEHFRRRRSVMAFFELSKAMHERLICRTLRSVEDWMAHHGFGAPPGRYCWFMLGCPGRGEWSVFCDCQSVFVFDGNGDDPDRNPYFQVFVRKAEERLGPLGLHCRITAAPAHFSWQGSMGEWRKRVADGMVGQRKNDELSVLTELSDLSLVQGDEELAGEMQNLVQGMLTFHHEALRLVARNVSEMPNGLDFFGRLRIEKSGPHRGGFDLEQYALEPLVGNLRIMAIMSGVTATGTVERIKELLEKGRITVELAERLLLAFHLLMTHKIEIESGGKGTPYLDVEGLDEQGERALKGSLEALVNLQRIVYQTFTEHG